MAEPFIGEIRVFAFTFAPTGWAFCDGQIMPINQNESLYCLLATRFGGDGTTTFGLPDLRGRVPIHTGYGLGLSPRYIGDKVGVDYVYLDENTMPQHNHNIVCTSNSADQTSPVGAIPANGTMAYYSSALEQSVDMVPGTMDQSGAGQPHDNMMPSLTLHYCISLQGIFPSRY